jgi:hypothetical protein
MLVAINEMIIAFTNAVRLSQTHFTSFVGSDEAELRFDNWQSLLLRNARIMADTCNEESESYELALDAFEATLKIYFPSIIQEVI